MRKQLATLAFTAALAAALTLFGCKEEKAKTPEAAADTVPQAEETAEAAKAEATPQAEKAELSSSESIEGKTLEQILAQIDIQVKVYSTEVEITTMSAGEKTYKQIKGLVLKINGTTQVFDEPNDLSFCNYILKYDFTPGATYDFELTSDSPKKNAKAKLTMLNTLKINPSKVVKGSFDLGLAFSSNIAPNLLQIEVEAWKDNNFGNFEKYIDSSLKKYTITKDFYDNYSKISAVNVRASNVAVSDKISFHTSIYESSSYNENNNIWQPYEGPE